MINITLKSGSTHSHVIDDFLKFYKKEEIDYVYDLHAKRNLTDKEIEYIKQYLEWEADYNIE
jgi:hypothetical protein